MAIERIHLLKVPVDILPPERMEEEILNLLQKAGTKQIILLSVWDLLKARRNDKFGECVRNADLVLPISKSIIRGASFLKLPVPIRYNPFSSIISLLSILESHYKSLYLFGGHKKTLVQAERNVHATFPNIKIIGRYVGYYPKNVETDIISAIYKASPSLVLVGDGVPEKNAWVFQRRNRFSSSTFIYNGDILNIFSKRKKRIPEKTFDKGLEIWSEIFHNPLKIFLFLPFMRYKFLLLWAKIKNNS
ncbi:MAG: WecB/TagA/CpsF family glycosyltransferase [Spirochaetaceae bacterium]|nr:WecB/TagA/CpsF family glycosyltransferase [Spirochaetaceae bacterium]